MRVVSVTNCAGSDTSLATGGQSEGYDISGGLDDQSSGWTASFHHKIGSSMRVVQGESEES